MVTVSHSILARWMNHSFQLLKEHGVNDVRQAEIYKAEPLVPDHFEIVMAIDKLKRHKSPGSSQIPAELIKAGVEQFALRSIDLLILFGIRRNCLRSGRS